MICGKYIKLNYGVTLVTLDWLLLKQVKVNQDIWIANF